MLRLLTKLVGCGLAVKRPFMALLFPFAFPPRTTRAA
jgi:hypothetical protein